MKKNSGYHAKSGVVLAAILAGSLFVATTAYAFYVYGLRDLHLEKETVLDLSTRDELPEEVSEKDIPKKEADIITLGGIAGSPEYTACNEWRTFLDGYDTDGAISSEIGNGFAGLGEYELIYNCYTQEMADKVNEICEKYGLSKLHGLTISDDYADLCRQVHIGDFCAGAEENVRWDFNGGYLYDNGTFLMEGNAALAGSSIYEVSYQFVRVEKGYFTSSYLDFGDLTECNVRAYTTTKGENVYFANIINEEWGTKTYIIAERDKSFIIINVLDDMSDITDVNDERLELLADAFDFAAVP